MAAQPPQQLGAATARIVATNERFNQLLLEQLDPAVWQAATPGKVRTVAAIFTHMHNVRSKWIRLNAPHLGVPPQLSRATCTPQQVSEALTLSAGLCLKMLAESAGSYELFRPDALLPPLRSGPEMLCHMLAHEAHHRGQICMLTHQLGHPLPPRVTSRMWRWGEAPSVHTAP